MPTLEFGGKPHIQTHYLTVPHCSLDAVPEKSVAADPSVSRPNEENLIIHGDNLDALKALLPRYAGRIKCVYIDPPYNTGNEGWIYNDNVNCDQMRRWLEEQKPVDGEDLERHDKWLCMMWPRLQLLRELLSDDGAIFISIDDNEQHRLRMMMDEIFGEENFVANIVWWSKYTLANDAKRVSNQHENILFYTKSIDDFNIGLLPRTEEMDNAYKNPDNDPRGPWKATPLHAKSGRDSDRYSVTFSNGVTWKCPEGRFPRYKKDRLLSLFEDGQLWFGKKGNSQPNKKTYLSEAKQGKTVGSMWTYNEVGSTHDSNEEISAILGKGVFPNPKGTPLIKRIITVANVGPEDIVLDSFAGSGTTAHAVLALNKEDGGNRRFVLVECLEYADRITAERVRRVIKGVPSAKDKALREGLGGSFTYCELGEPISIEGMLSGEALPSFESLASYLLYTAAGITAEGALQPLNEDGLFYQDEGGDYYLLYEPNVEYLRSPEAKLDMERAQLIKERGKKALVFGPEKEMGQRDLKKMRIAFCQLPYEFKRAW